MQIYLGEQKILCADRLYLPQTTHIKHIFNRLFFFYWSIGHFSSFFPSFYSFFYLLLTHFFLVLEFKELCIKSQLGFVYFFQLEKKDRT